MRRDVPVFAAAILASILGLSVLISESSAEIRVIAATGQAAPGLPGDQEFSYFLDNPPTINNLGEVAFVARSMSVSSPSGFLTGIWTTAENQLAPLATDSDSAPGIAKGRAFTLWFNNVAINGSGATAFDDRIEWWHSDVKPGTEGGIWSNHDGNLKLVVRMGDPAPGAPPGSVLDALPMDLRFNDAGDLAFLAQFDDGLDNNRDPSRHGIWMHSGEELLPIAITGGPAPGYDGGSFQTIDAPLLNNGGHVAFTGIARVEGTPHRGLWSNRNGSLSPVLLEGDLLPIPSQDTAPTVGSMRFALNVNDSIAISSTVKLPDNQTRSGFWLENSGGISLVMFQGQHAPGTPAASVFRSGPGEFSLNDVGQIAFLTSFTTDKVRFEPRLGDFVSVFESGIWFYDDEELQLVARQGDLAPNFATQTRFTNFSPPMLNALGQVVFKADLETLDEAGAPIRLTSLWATDLNGNLNMIASSGMQIDVDNGPGVDLRQILSIEFGHVLETIGTRVGVYTGTTDGRGRSFNDRGQLAFHARISDGSGLGSAVLVVDTLAIPEPTSQYLAGCLCLAMFAAPMRKRSLRAADGRRH